MKPGAERLATTAVFLANGLGTGAWAVEVPRIKEMLALSHAALGLALFVFALGALAAMGLTGRLVAKLGSGRGTALMGGAFIIALPLPALAPDFALLCLALFALGASSGAMDVAMNGHASALEAQRARPIMSSFHAAWSVGGLLGAALGAAVHAGGLGVAAGLALPDLAIAALVLGSAGLALRAVDAPARAAGGLVLPSAVLGKLAGLAFICLLVEGAVADWSAVYLRTALTARAGAAALGYASFALTMAACRLVGDRLVRRLGSRMVVSWGGLTAAAGFALVLGLPSVVTACLGFALVGLGLANTVPVVFSAAGRSTPVPAVGISMAATVGYVGLLVGPPLIGFGASLLGLRLALGLLLLASAGVGLFGARAVAERVSAK
jgi:MFS family permease